MSLNEKIKHCCALAKEAGHQELYGELLEIRELLMEQASDEVAGLQFRDGAYYRDGDEVPFCPHCKEVEQKAIHLSCLYELEKGLYDSDPGGTGWQWQCLHCKNEIRLPHGK